MTDFALPVLCGALLPVLKHLDGKHGKQPFHFEHACNNLCLDCASVQANAAHASTPSHTERPSVSSAVCGHSHNFTCTVAHCSTCGGERAICSFGQFCETMNLFGYVSPVRRQLSRVACSIVQNWEASFNPLDAQFSVSHVQYWETSFNPLDVSASVVRSMSVPTKTFLSLSRRVSRDLQSRAINRVLNNRDASCKVAQSHAISTVVRKRKQSLLRFGACRVLHSRAVPCNVEQRRA